MGPRMPELPSDHSFQVFQFTNACCVPVWARYGFMCHFELDHGWGITLHINKLKLEGNSAMPGSQRQ